MGHGPIGNLVTHPGRQDDAAAVIELGMELAFEAEEDVAFSHQ